MIKIGLLTAVAEEDGSYVDAMELTEFAAELRLDYVDYHTRKGLGSTDHGYLSRLKYLAVKQGLLIGHLTIAGSFNGPPERKERLALPDRRSVGPSGTLQDGQDQEGAAGD